MSPRGSVYELSGPSVDPWGIRHIMLTLLETKFLGETLNYCPSNKDVNQLGKSCPFLMGRIFCKENFSVLNEQLLKLLFQL